MMLWTTHLTHLNQTRRKTEATWIKWNPKQQHLRQSTRVVKFPMLLIGLHKKGSIQTALKQIMKPQQSQKQTILRSERSGQLWPAYVKNINIASPRHQQDAWVPMGLAYWSLHQACQENLLLDMIWYVSAWQTNHGMHELERANAFFSGVNHCVICTLRNRPYFWPKHGDTRWHVVDLPESETWAQYQQPNFWLRLLPSTEFSLPTVPHSFFIKAHALWRLLWVNVRFVPFAFLSSLKRQRKR